MNLSKTQLAVLNNIRWYEAIFEAVARRSPPRGHGSPLSTCAIEILILFVAHLRSPSVGYRGPFGLTCRWP